MGREKISRKAWQRATNALLWYPDNKVEYNSLFDELTTRDPEHSGGSSKPMHRDPTADSGIRLATDARRQCLRQEIDAVEEATKNLLPEQLEVIRQRYWRKHYGGRRKPVKYDYLSELGYSVIGMRKIVRHVIIVIAAKLGER